MKPILQFGRKEEGREEQVSPEVALRDAKSCDSFQTGNSEYGSLDSGKGSQLSEKEPLAVSASKKDAFWKKWKEDRKAEVSQTVRWIGTTRETEGLGSMKTFLAVVPAVEGVEVSGTSLEKDKANSEQTGMGTQVGTDKVDVQDDKRLLFLNDPAEYLALASRNLKQSSLLRLPLAIRKRIYKFVFGGVDIHVDWMKLAPLHYLFPLLRTCRQTYLETRLLPYELNNVVFIEQGNFWKYIDGLRTEQRNAIKSIRCMMDQADPERVCPLGFEPWLATGLYLLRGLESVTVVWDRCYQTNCEDLQDEVEWGLREVIGTKDLEVRFLGGPRGG